MKTEQEIIDLLNNKINESNRLVYNYRKKGNKGYNLPYLAVEIKLLKEILK